MTVFCVQAELAFSNANRRNTILQAIETRIDGKSRWGADDIEARASKVGANGLAVTLRFTSQLDQEDLLARIEEVGTGPNAPLAGSWVRLHPCSHDGADAPCTVASERVW